MPDAAGNVRAGRRNPTVGDSHRRACGGFACAALCHNGDIPDTVVSRRGEAGRGGGAGQEKSTKNRRNAIKTHESDPCYVCDGTGFNGTIVSKVCRIAAMADFLCFTSS